jgi:transglutaminase-like putative cysteine protease
MNYEVAHATTYNYRDSVSLSHHVLRMTPRGLAHQRCLSHEVQIDPPPTVLRTHFDYFNNPVTFVTIEGAHKSLTVKSTSKVLVTHPFLPVPAETPAWETVREFSRGLQIGSSLEACEFIFDSPLVKTTEQFADYARPSFLRDRPILEAVLALTFQIHADFKFDNEATTISTPLVEVFKNRRGVCQDFAHLQIACLRSLGLPARYVSGYLETEPPPGQPRLAGADASHAWLAFYSHGLGWIDVDPTNNILPTSRHITLAWGRDYSDVSPLRGVILGSGKHSLDVAVDVVPVFVNATSAANDETSSAQPPKASS